MGEALEEVVFMIPIWYIKKAMSIAAERRFRTTAKVPVEIRVTCKRYHIRNDVVSLFVYGGITWAVEVAGRSP